MISGDQVAADAQRWAGEGYVYGGTAAHPGDWDCSSYATFVLHRLGLAVPGGKWGAPGMPPNAHGPTVESYAAWKGAITVAAPGARGDLVLFVGSGTSGHMGIVLGPDRMVSALDSVDGTLETPITGYGPPGAPIVYRRVLGTLPGTAVGGAAGAATGQPGSLQAAGEAALLIAGMVGVVVAAAAVLGAAVVLGGTWLLSKAVADA